MKNVKRRMTPQPLKIRADVELTCFSYDGVLHIQVRRALPCDMMIMVFILLTCHHISHI